ncbi:ArsR/SmtB family transcription factor [Catalinimonas niigatensis]|uniref:ArsR/SmtB family transcription factor n=1 Tax=Catalinimonas niigatensis TaxID=1397264 RepID=UPI002666A7F7|nr:metalloregulator ArsR/SmtB family transcription factor [Catalinimonas niigatensis]WPP53129.1 metalloregulator ArsR/SmtB family transcription factor [Catalinimonas niigatensis]
MRVKNFSLTFGLELFKAFSDEARVRILFLLHQEEEMCITDLEHILDFTQTKTSRHLRYLKNTNLVSSRKVDQFVYYRIRNQTRDVITQIFQYMNKDTTLLKDMETFRILYSNRELAVWKLHHQNKPSSR